MKRYLNTGILLLFISSGLYSQLLYERSTDTRILPDHITMPYTRENTEGHYFHKNSLNVFFYEGFEEPTENGLLPAGWEVKRTSALNEAPVTNADWPHWFRNSLSFDGFQYPAEYIYDGNGSMGIAWFASEFTWAISPSFEIPNVESDVNLTYWVWYLNDYYEGIMYYSNYHIRIFADSQWHTLQSVIGNDDNSNLYESKVTVNLNPYRGKEVRLAFIHEYTDGWQMAFDEIVVSEVLQIDFGVKNLEVFPDFGVLPGTELDITVKAQSNSENAGSVNVSLFVNGEEKALKPTGNLNDFGMEETMRFLWVPEYFGRHTIEIRLPFDENNNNNSVKRDIYVHHYHNLAEGFENYELDELGFPVYTFPPSGWSITSNQWIEPTFQYQVSGKSAAFMIGRINIPEHSLLTPAIEFGENDDWLRFSIRGVNNNVNINPGQYPGAYPPGIQGYSTIQVRYAESQDGPWIDLGNPVEFKNIYNDNGNLIQSANGIRTVEIDVSGLQGNYHLGFFHSSSFALTISGTPFYSYAIVDDIMIGNDPYEVTFRVKRANGTNLNDAVVKIYDENNRLIRNLRTSSSGQVKAPLLEGDYTYKVMKLGYESAQGAFSPDETLLELEVILEESQNVYYVDFTVLKSNGDPAENTEIIISSFSGLTDSNGKLLIDNLSSGQYDFTAYLSGFTTARGVITIDNQNVSHTVELTILSTSAEIARIDDQLLLYPNPAHGIVNLKMQQRMNALEIFDLSGNLIRRETIHDNFHTINLQGVQQGMYLLRVYSENGVIVNKLQLH